MNIKVRRRRSFQRAQIADDLTVCNSLSALADPAIKSAYLGITVEHRRNQGGHLDRGASRSNPSGGDENLCLAGFHLTLTALAKAHHICPIWAERQAQLSCGLSGGQQQMVAIGHALMASPRLF